MESTDFRKFEYGTRAAEAERGVIPRVFAERQVSTRAQDVSASCAPWFQPMIVKSKLCFSNCKGPSFPYLRWSSSSELGRPLIPSDATEENAGCCFPRFAAKPSDDLQEDVEIPYYPPR
jgi:hypothetical protein